MTQLSRLLAPIHHEHMKLNELNMCKQSLCVPGSLSLRQHTRAWERGWDGRYRIVVSACSLANLRLVTWQHMETYNEAPWHERSMNHISLKKQKGGMSSVAFLRLP